MPTQKKCKHCHGLFTKDHRCPKLQREVEHDDEDNFLAAVIATEIAVDLLSGASDSSSVIDSSTFDTPAADFGGDGGDFGGGGSSGDW